MTEFFVHLVFFSKQCKEILLTFLIWYLKFVAKTMLMSDCHNKQQEFTFIVLRKKSKFAIRMYLS